MVFTARLHQIGLHLWNRTILSVGNDGHKLFPIFSLSAVSLGRRIRSKESGTPSCYNSSILLLFIQVGGSLDIPLGACYVRKFRRIAALLGRALLNHQFQFLSSIFYYQPLLLIADHRARDYVCVMSDKSNGDVESWAVARASRARTSGLAFQPETACIYVDYITLNIAWNPSSPCNNHMLGPSQLCLPHAPFSWL